ncbi:MAG: PAS domain S-box protein, partial [Chloroflexota bacterium]|nr:PAS domain S-box protein [Chloroflexota bacterium]
ALLKDELEHVLGLLIIMENVTGHRRNEGELRESESLYHLIADNVTDVIWLTDANWNITYMTPSAKAWGYQVEDLQGKSILELINQAIPPETIDSIIKQVGSMSIDTAMHDIVHKKKGQSAIYPLTLMDGSTIWIEAIFNVLTDCNGNITGLMGISRDVTERKQAEEELRHREERFETLTENISDAIAVVGLDGITISVTSSVERIIGYKPEDLVGKNGLELIHPEELPEAIDLLGYLVGNPGAAMSTELRYLHKNGDWIWMEMNARNLLDDPNIQGIVVNYHDITERKQTEELLQQSEEHFRTLIENASDAIAIIDANGIITYESASVEKLLGYRPDELIGRQAFDLVYPDDLWWILSLFQGMSENPGDMRAIETRLLSVDGTWRWFEITSQNLLQNTSIQGFVINYRDITDRKQADDLLRQSNRELQELVHISAHNLREPLRKITAFSGMLVESLSGRLDEDEQENLSFIIDGSRNMQKMVDALHSYSQLMIKEEHLHNVDLNRMIKNLQEIKLLPKLRETNGRIEIPEPLPTVHANNTQMYQLFNHLISNSLKYHKEDSSPRIVVRSKQVDGNMVQVEVEDNGIGIEEEHQEEVFGMFRRLHHPYDEDEGTGMGLTFCQKIVRRHGGEMGVKSSLGEGSIFWFTLPAVTPKEI